MSLFWSAHILFLLHAILVPVTAQSSSSSGLGSLILQGLGSSATTNASTASSSSTTYALHFSNTSSILGTGNSATITAAPKLRNLTTAAISTPSGFAIVNNITFPTSCPHSDLGCYETCSSLAVDCMSTWEAWQQGQQSCIPVSTVEYTTETKVETFISTDYGLGVLSFSKEFIEPATTMTIVSAYSDIPDCSLPSVTTTVTSKGYTYVSSSNPCVTYVNETRTVIASTETESYFGTYATSTGSATYTSIWSTEWTQTSSICSYSVPPPSCPFSVGVYDGKCKRGPDCNKCTIYGGTVQLLYFPVSTTGTMSFAPVSTSVYNATGNARRAVSNSSEPVLATYDGLTMTSPSVYISLATVYALNECNSTVGQARTGSIISLDPTDLSSALGNWHARITDTSLAAEGSMQVSIYPLSFDLKDLNWPYNPYGWEEQSRCNDYIAMTCPIILKGEYNPVLVVPSQIRTLDPAWSTCALDLEGLYDPPKALTPVANEAAPTINPGNGATTTTEAQPSPTAASPTPTSTNNAVPGPSTPEAAGSTATAQPQASTATSAGVAESDQVDPSSDPAPQETPGTSEEQQPSAAQPTSAAAEATGGDASNNGGSAQSGGSNVATGEAQPTTADTSNNDDPSQSGGADVTTDQAQPTSAGSSNNDDPSQSGGADGTTGEAQPTSADSSNNDDPSQSTGVNPGTGQGATAQASQAQGGGQAGAGTENTLAQSTALPSPVGTVGSGAEAATFVSDPSANGGVVVQSQGGSTTLQAGATGAINGQTYSVNSDGNAVVGVASTVQLPAADSPNSQSAASPSAYVIAGTTFAAGGSAVNVASVQYSALPSGGGLVAVSGGVTTTLTGAAQAAITLGSGAVATPAQAQAQSAYVVSGTTISPGASAVVVDGATLSALSSGGIVAVSNGATNTLTGDAQGAITLGSGVVATAAQADLGSGQTQSAYVVSGTTISPGASAITVNGATLSALSSGEGIVAVSNGATTTLSGGAQGAVTLGSGVVATLAPAGTGSGQAQQAYVVSGTTISPGSSPLSVDGATISALPSGGGLVVASDGTTRTVPAGSNGAITLGSGLVASQVEGNPAAASTINGLAVSAAPDGVVVGGQTLTAGGSAAKISGQVYSVNTAGRLVIGSSTTLGQGNMVASLLAAIQDAASQGLGGSTTDTSATATTGTGAASTLGSSRSRASSSEQTASGAATTTASSSSPRAVEMEGCLIGLSLVFVLYKLFC